MSALALISAALTYPDDALAAERPAIAEAVRDLPPSPARDALLGFMGWWAAEPADALRRRYVETFDFSRRSGLDLTYYTHGDRRQRGLALLELRRRYEAAGLEADGPELPDHLPVVLEFATLDAGGVAILDDFRPVLEVLRMSLARGGSPWAAVLDALCALLAPLDDAGRAEVVRLAREGPPGESVGLEPFAPPEVMPAPARPAGPACAGVTTEGAR